MQVSIYLIQFDCFEYREQAPLYTQREKDKVRMREEKAAGTTKQWYHNPQ